MRWPYLKRNPLFNAFFDEEFIANYCGIKRGEFETFMEVISPWEREYLLLNV